MANAPSPLSTHLAARWLRALGDGATYGVSYAAARFWMSSPRPPDPEKIWDFWVQTLPSSIQVFVDHYPPPRQRRRLMRRLLAQPHASGIEEHYDISNEFYALFLDREFMFYSCADFNTPHDTLEDAQRNKAEYLLKLIDPQPGEKILELGCGWGSMLRFIHSTTGDAQNLHGYTLSREQAHYVKSNFGFNVLLDDFIAAEYQPASYDKIYSIGAMEHVRPHEILPLLKKLHAALKPGGRLVQHFFSLNHDPLPTAMLAGQVVFPGSTLAMHSYHVQAARAAGFRITHDSTHDYRPTLRAWFDRLVEDQDKALELVGLRVLNRYLTFFPGAWAMFNEDVTTLHRMVLEKT